MSEEANTIIDGLGGTSAVHRMLSAPMSTVHSWRKNGIPPSRLAHLKLAAAAEGRSWPLDSECGAAGSPGKSAEISPAIAEGA